MKGIFIAALCAATLLASCTAPVYNGWALNGAKAAFVSSARNCDLPTGQQVSLCLTVAMDKFAKDVSLTRPDLVRTYDARVMQLVEAKERKQITADQFWHEELAARQQFAKTMQLAEQYRQNAASNEFSGFMAASVIAASQPPSHPTYVPSTLTAPVRPAIQAQAQAPSPSLPPKITPLAAKPSMAICTSVVSGAVVETACDAP